MDLDNEEEKATKEINGTAKLNRKAQLQKVIDKVNSVTKEIGELAPVKHVMVVAYVENEDVHGFIQSADNLSSLEGQTTFLLDYCSQNIKEQVRRKAVAITDEIKKIIDEEENKDGK